MNSRRQSPAVSIFVLGVALGGAASWCIFAPSSTEPVSKTDSASSAFVVPAWSWTSSATPPVFDRDQAAAAISAWFALRDSEGRPVAFAQRVDALRALLLRLPAGAFPRLLDGLAARATPDERRLCQIAFEAWIGLDPAAAARWAGAASKDRLDLARLATRAWAAQDPAAAAAWACGLPDQSVSDELAALTLPSLAAKDPAQALALVSTRNAASRDHLVAAIVESLAKTDPAAALRIYGPGLWKNGEGFWHLQAPLSAWAKADPAAAIAWLLAQPRQNDGQLDAWLTQLVHLHPDRGRIAAILAEIPALPNRVQNLANVMFAWGAQKPREALAWLDSLGDPVLRLNLLRLCSSHRLSDAPQKTLPFILALPEGADRSDRLRFLLQSWAETDSSAALAWMRTQSEPDVTAAFSTVQATLLATIARDEPATAVAEWASLTDVQSKRTALTHIAEAWGRTDPEAALKWATSEEVRRAAGVENNGAHANLLYAWSQKDPEAALRWAEAWTEARLAQNGSKLSTGIYTYLNALAGYEADRSDRADRASAADLYAKIKNPALRTEMLAGHVRDWIAHDANAARAWLETNNALTPDQAAALLAPGR